MVPHHLVSTLMPNTPTTSCFATRTLNAVKIILMVVVLGGMTASRSLVAQMPFYTDDTNVTDKGTLHFEFFNELDRLQTTLYPDTGQNTANFKLNYGLGHGVELDVDIPYLDIYHAAGERTSRGHGDTNMGVKWEFKTAPKPRRSPALAASFYVEAPTGDPTQELGSGLADYALNFIAQEPLTDKTRITANAGFLFAGNTSTGVVGLQTTRGHVFTASCSLEHDFTPRLMLGAEIYLGVSDNTGLGKGQIQGLGGGAYEVRNGMSVTFALLGGHDVGSPRLGAQVGFEMDLPAALHKASAKPTPAKDVQK
jgi:hypothetical protein